eukprot:scaffold8049_cov286-Pinguiococcus_pyrenoidosus.AAC.4
MDALPHRCTAQGVLVPDDDGGFSRSADRNVEPSRVPHEAQRSAPIGPDAAENDDILLGPLSGVHRGDADVRKFNQSPLKELFLRRVEAYDEDLLPAPAWGLLGQPLEQLFKQERLANVRVAGRDRVEAAASTSVEFRLTSRLLLRRMMQPEQSAASHTQALLSSNPVGMKLSTVERARDSVADLRMHPILRCEHRDAFS